MLWIEMVERRWQRGEQLDDDEARQLERYYEIEALAADLEARERQDERYPIEPEERARMDAQWAIVIAWDRAQR